MPEAGIAVGRERNFTGHGDAGIGQNGKEGVLHGIVAAREVHSGATHEMIPLRGDGLAAAVAPARGVSPKDGRAEPPAQAEARNLLTRRRNA